MLAIVLSVSQRDAADALRVLFIGNSLTTAHDLPALVHAVSVGRGREIEPRVVAYPNYSLEDHWNRGDASKAIAEGGWSIVVLQQGPSALPESRVLLVEYARRFAAQIRKAGARPALYMVWPSAERQFDFEAVSLSYATAAREADGLLLPVGEAWRAAWRRDGKIELYGPDGFHPTPLAAYLAAIVMYQQLSGRSPIGLPSTLIAHPGETPFAIPELIAAKLQQAAADANAKFTR